MSFVKEAHLVLLLDVLEHQGRQGSLAMKRLELEAGVLHKLEHFMVRAIEQRKVGPDIENPGRPFSDNTGLQKRRVKHGDLPSILTKRHNDAMLPQCLQRQFEAFRALRVEKKYCPCASICTGID